MCVGVGINHSPLESSFRSSLERANPLASNLIPASSPSSLTPGLQRQCGAMGTAAKFLLRDALLGRLGLGLWGVANGVLAVAVGGATGVSTSLEHLAESCSVYA